MPTLPIPMLLSVDFMRLHRRYDLTLQPRSFSNVDISASGDTIQREDAIAFRNFHPFHAIGPWILLVLLITLMFWLLRKTLRGQPKPDIPTDPLSRKPIYATDRPFDPYLQYTNTSLDASIIAANEPSFKHTTIPPRAYCASRQREKDDLDIQWYTPRAYSFVSCAGPGYFYHPNGIWDSPSCSTSAPDQPWKGGFEKGVRMSSPPAYPLGEGSRNFYEKEPQVKP